MDQDGSVDRDLGRDALVDRDRDRGAWVGRDLDWLEAVVDWADIQIYLHWIGCIACGVRI